MANSPCQLRPGLPRPCIQRWVVVISGFLQDEGQPTGMVGLWASLHHDLSSSYTRVELRSWDDDWQTVAEFIWRQRPPGDGLDVCIFAYSWGGPSAMALAEELGLRGIAVRHMVLSDPVYRHRWKFWRVFWRWPRISVPPNVRFVSWFRQHMDWPEGHDLVAEDPDRTAIRPPTVLARGHSTMDDANRFHRVCHLVAEEGLR